MANLRDLLNGVGNFTRQANQTLLGWAANPLANAIQPGTAQRYQQLTNTRPANLPIANVQRALRPAANFVLSSYKNPQYHRPVQIVDPVSTLNRNITNRAVKVFDNTVGRLPIEASFGPKNVWRGNLSQGARNTIKLGKDINQGVDDFESGIRQAFVRVGGNLYNDYRAGVEGKRTPFDPSRNKVTQFLYGNEPLKGTEAYGQDTMDAIAPNWGTNLADKNQRILAGVALGAADLAIGPGKAVSATDDFARLAAKLSRSSEVREAAAKYGIKLDSAAVEAVTKADNPAQISRIVRQRPLLREELGSLSAGHGLEVAPMGRYGSHEITHRGNTVGTVRERMSHESNLAYADFLQKHLAKIGTEQTAKLESQMGLTTKVLRRLSDKPMLNRQAIENELRRPDVKDAEKTVIQAALGKQSGKFLDREEFIDDVQRGLVGLTRQVEDRYRDARMPSHVDDPKRSGYRATVYQGPAEAREAADGHFGGSSVPNYFAHTRADLVGANPELELVRMSSTADSWAVAPKGSTALGHLLSDAMPKVEAQKLLRKLRRAAPPQPGARRIIEMQSDLFQKPHNIDYARPQAQLGDFRASDFALALDRSGSVAKVIADAVKDPGYTPERVLRVIKDAKENAAYHLDRAKEIVKRANEKVTQAQESLDILKLAAADLAKKGRTDLPQLSEFLDESDRLAATLGPKLPEYERLLTRAMTEAQTELTNARTQMTALKRKARRMKQVEDLIAANPLPPATGDVTLEGRQAAYDATMAYQSTWVDRIMREEVKQAAKEGHAEVRFPTGHTAAITEGWAQVPGSAHDRRTWENLQSRTAIGDTFFRPEPDNTRYRLIGRDGDTVEAVDFTEARTMFRSNLEEEARDGYYEDWAAEIRRLEPGTELTEDAGEVYYQLSTSERETIQRQGGDAWLETDNHLDELWDKADTYAREEYQSPSDVIDELENRYGGRVLDLDDDGEHFLVIDENAEVHRFTEEDFKVPGPEKGRALDEGFKRDQLAERHRGLYDRYEREVPKSLKRLFPDHFVGREVDPQGVSWWVVRGITPEMGQEAMDAFGGMAGFSFETDDQGNVTGFKFDPLMAAAGVVGVGGMRKLKGGAPTVKQATKGVKVVEATTLSPRLGGGRPADMGLADLNISTHLPRASAGERATEVVEDLRTNYMNRFTPVEDMVRVAEKTSGGPLRPSQNPATLLKRFTGSMGIANQRIDHDLTPILRQADNFDDLRAYMVAQRFNELSRRPDLPKSPKDPKVPRADKALAELAAKVGPEGMVKLQTIADQLYTYQRSFLDELAAPGVEALSPEQVQQIARSNQRYVPFDRVVEQAEASGLVSGADLNARRSGVMRLSNPGSALPIVDPLESIIRNTYQMTQIIEKQRAMRALVNLGEFEKIDPAMVPVAKTVHKAAVDADYIASLTKFGRSLGMRGVKTEGQIKRGVLGHFSPSTQQVTRFHGSPADTVAHEVGHFLDHKFGLKQKFYAKGATKELGEELVKHMMAIGQSGNRTASASERFAHAFEWWLSNRHLAKQDIPKFSRRMEELIKETPELKPLLKDVRPSGSFSLEANVEQIFAPSPFEPRQPHVTVMENGRKAFYATDQRLASAIAGVNEEQLNTAVRIMAFPARTLRAGATALNVGFAVPNVLRDQFSAAVNAKYGYIPFLDFAQGLAARIGKTEQWQDFLRSGADQATMAAQERTTLQRSIKEVEGGFGVRAGKLLSSPLELLRAFGQFSEEGTRTGVFIRNRRGAEKAGLKRFGDEWTDFDSQLGGMVEAREATVDFSRRGAKMKAWNAMDAFLNARLQGSLKFIESARKRPVQTAAIGTAIAGVPAALLYMHNRQDPAFDEVPAYIKDHYFILMTGNPDMPFYKIPKGEVGAIFANPVEQFLATVYDEDPQGWPEVATTLALELSPIKSPLDIIPTFAKVPTEIATNYDTFRDRNIVSPYKKDLPPELQYDDRTSETAKAIGGAIKVSPAKLEHGFLGLTGGLGRQVLQGADALQGKFPDSLADLPVLDRFLGEPQDLNASASTIYESLDADKSARARENVRLKGALAEGDTSGLNGLDRSRANSLLRGAREDDLTANLSPRQRALYQASDDQLDAFATEHPEWADDIERVRAIKDEVSGNSLDPQQSFKLHYQEYQRDRSAGRLSQLEDYQTRLSLVKEYITKDYDDDVVSLYGMSKSRIQAAIAASPGLEKLLPQVYALDAKLANTGLASRKFKNGISKGSGKGKKLAIKIAKPRAIKSPSSIRLKGLSSTKKPGVKVASFKPLDIGNLPF